MKRGFTLIELLVYMAIMGFIIIVAGRVFSDSTNMRVRSQNMIKTAEEVGKIANLISEDISQMGVKAWGKLEGNEYKIYNTENANASWKLDNVYMDPKATTYPDSSSFELTRDYMASGKDDNLFDRLVFRKAEFDEDKGDFLGVREVTWEVNKDNRLIRRCKTIATTNIKSDACPDGGNEVIIADNIKEFSFFLSKPGMPDDLTQNDTVFPLPSSQPNSKSFRLLPNSSGNNNNMKQITPEYSDGADGTIASICNEFSPNPNNTTEKSFYENYLAPYGETNFSNCLEVPIKKGETYVVEFNTPFPKDNDACLGDVDPKNSGQFLPGKDHFAVGLRLNNGKDAPNTSPDVLLYASQSDEANDRPRYAEFTANDNFTLNNNEKVCVALTFSFYSALVAEGKLIFKNFKVFKKPTGAYHFVKKSNKYTDEDEDNYAIDKIGNSAIPINHQDKRAHITHKRNVKALELLLEIERNGEVAGTVSKDSKGMVIPVPNNGVTSL